MRVRWTEPAESDLLGICDHIARNDAQAAARVGRRLLDAVESLRPLPRRGRPGRIAGTRELVVPRLPYIIVYRPVDVGPEPGIVVLRIIHGARHWPARHR